MHFSKEHVQDSLTLNNSNLFCLGRSSTNFQTCTVVYSFWAVLCIFERVYREIFQTCTGRPLHRTPIAHDAHCTERPCTERPKTIYYYDDSLKTLKSRLNLAKTDEENQLFADAYTSNVDG